MVSEMFLVIFIQLWSLIFGQYSYQITDEHFICNATTMYNIQWAISDVLDIPLEHVEINCRT